MPSRDVPAPTHLTVLVPLVPMKPLLRLMDLDRIMGVLVS